MVWTSPDSLNFHHHVNSHLLRERVLGFAARFWLWQLGAGGRERRGGEKWGLEWRNVTTQISVRRRQKPPPCWTGPVPAGSKMNLPLAKEWKNGDQFRGGVPPPALLVPVPKQDHHVVMGWLWLSARCLPNCPFSFSFSFLDWTERKKKMKSLWV